MKRQLTLFICLLSFTTVICQSPGGVSQSDIWAKVIKNSPAATFQYKDFSKNTKAITLGPSTSLSPSLLNYNYSYTYNASSYVSFLSKIENLKDATIFVVSQPIPPSNPSDFLALMSTDWNPSVPVTAGSVNEQSFKLSTSIVEKNNTSLPYPTTSGTRPNARINTLVWHNFNSRKIVNSYGVNGESDVFVGKSFTGAVNFQGEIPEFIVYRKALNDKEKARVESYLAVKYGITLGPDANYYTSKNEIFWHKENNQFFNNRIIGLGQDSNSSLYQRQSASSHDVNTPKKLIFWTGTLDTDNYLNTTYIDDQNFIMLGDNNASETPNIVLNNGIKKIDRTWIAEKFGPSAHNLETSLKYKPNGITLNPNEALWLMIDRNATNTNVSDFNSTSGYDVYQVTSLTTDGYAVYNNLKWGSSANSFNQFTFGVGPKMVVDVAAEPMGCNDTSGMVDFTIRGGEPLFTVNIHGTDNTYTDQSIQPNRQFILSLAPGSYQITITDGNSFSTTSSFVVTPTPGMNLELGPNQQVAVGNSITLNAATNVTVPNVSYSWYFQPQSGAASASPFSTDASVTVNDLGTYRCVILNNTTGCSVEDSMVLSNSAPRLSYSKVYPNPSAGHFSVSITLNEIKDAELTVYDVTGKTLINDYFNGLNQYQSEYQLNNTGIYFVRIKAKGYDQTHKLIIN